MESFPNEYSHAGLNDHYSFHLHSFNQFNMFQIITPIAHVPGTSHNFNGQFFMRFLMAIFGSVIFVFITYFIFHFNNYLLKLHLVFSM